ncbi:hypothetical protein [Cyanobium sp. Morenito 9A2]|uniref:hypothetical protein n=1 Tax=Cyanobium sp. Morenito 9A2 TaxID=2823718 RepID=UPI0020CC00C3|nr:hypothetical protein [Cyanobium sp. Morenito 9A2]MCP9848922.1 hypothetical protein [Cyanobium sp. Morenito 9A2]
MERQLMLALVVTAVLAGTGLAITRPFLFRLGQDGPPSASDSRGVSYRGAYLAGSWRPATPSRDWAGFQGRGPGGAK